MPDPADPDGWTTVNIIDAQVRYAYDLLGRLETVTTDRRNRYPVVFDPQNPTLDETTRYTYNTVGSLKSIDYPNGQTAIYDYDALNRLTDLVWSKDAAETYRYHYDNYAGGQRAAVQEYYAGAVTPTAESEWTYDNLNRLTEEVFADGANDYTRRYGYDLVGNRKTVKDGTDSILTSYSYNDLDQLTFEDHTAGQDYSYVYDANGSLEQRIHGTDLQNDPADIYVYNLQGRLAGYTPAGAGTVTYAYNPQGIRIAKTAAGVTTHYTISPHNFTGYAQVLAADDGTNRTFYVLGSDVIGQSLNTAAPMYFLYDGHGSVRQDTDAAGTVIGTYTYDAYGNLIGGNPAADGLYYTGEMYDASLDSYYLRARYYAPATGRFNRLDPYAGNSYDPQSLHKYLYCNGNPINGVDPTGNFFTIVDVLSSLNLSDLIDNMKNAKDAVVKRGIDEVRGEMLDQLKDAFNWSDPPPIPLVAQYAETMWLMRLQMLGIQAIPLQSTPVGQHGPDIVGFGYIGGKFTLIVGEIKGMKSSKMLSSLHRLSDGSMQMSANWINQYIDMLVNPIVDAVVNAGADALIPGAGKQIKEKLKDQSQFELYLLRARYYSNRTWTLRGFRLLRVGDTEVIAGGSLKHSIGMEYNISAPPGMIP